MHARENKPFWHCLAVHIDADRRNQLRAQTTDFCGDSIDGAYNWFVGILMLCFFSFSHFMLHFAIDHLNRTRLPYNFRFQCEKKEKLYKINLEMYWISSCFLISIVERRMHLSHFRRKSTIFIIIKEMKLQHRRWPAICVNLLRTNNQFHVSNEVVTAIHFSRCSVRSRAES